MNNQNRDWNATSSNLPVPLPNYTPASEQINSYLEYCRWRLRRSESTINTKRWHLLCFVRDTALGDFRELTNSTLDRYCMGMVQANMASKTINGHLDDITGVIKYLHRQNEITRLNLNFVERLRTTDDLDDLPSFTAVEVAKVKSHCVTLREELLVSMIFESAMRIHEVVKLRVEEVDGRHLRITGKGGKKRDTFILAPTQRLLERWLTMCGIVEGFVLPSPVNPDKPLSRQQVSSIITRPIRSAGFLEGSAHALRRGSITSALENGMELPDAAKWAGHSDPRITMKHYYKVKRERLAVEHEKAFKHVDKHVDNALAMR